MARTPRQQRLVQELIRVRDLAGISGREVGRRIQAALPGQKGTSQGSISRIDTGQGVPSMPVVRAWLAACDVDEQNRERIEALAEAALSETRPWADLLKEEQHLQGVARERELASTRVRNFQPTVVAALLQTPEYAAGIIPRADLTDSTDHQAAIASRLQRQQILYDDSRRFQFVMTEHVLRWAPGPRELLVAQRDRIASLASLDTVDVAIVPETSPALVPWHNFVIWEPADGDPYVTSELVTGEPEHHDPDQVALFEQLWDRMWKAAVHGDAARALIREVS